MSVWIFFGSLFVSRFWWESHLLLYQFDNCTSLREYVLSFNAVTLWASRPLSPVPELPSQVGASVYLIRHDL